MLSRLQSDYQDLMSHCNEYINTHALACMLSSYKNCCSDMPDYLGLSSSDFHRMMTDHFPSADWSKQAYSRRTTALHNRDDEKEMILDLLWEHRCNSDNTTMWVAKIIAAGCMGNDHLWQDLGLWSRADLSALIRSNFPVLAEKNKCDMKWKRFFYRMLCERGGYRICRSPSCDVCIDYNICFGEED